MKLDYEAVVIGSGPNGLAAAVELARNGRRVAVFEKHGEPGGGARTEEGPLPGFYHDVCASVFPMAAGSPFFTQLPLEDYGLRWIQPGIPLAHPFDDGNAAVLHRSVEDTAAQFNFPDARAYRKWMKPLTKNADRIFSDLLGPFRMPTRPAAAMRFAWSTLVSPVRFIESPARALFAGNAAHSVLPLESFAAPAAIGQMLMLAGHRFGWPFAQGGAASITRALSNYLIELKGEIVRECEVASLSDLPNARVYLFDTGPHALAEIAGDRLPASYQRKLLNYRYGPGIFKIDYALSDPVPWKSEACRRSGTVHVGGETEEIARSERSAFRGEHSARPFVLTAQPSLVDSSRAPSGKHIFWAYCHVPAGSEVDMTEPIENQIERFAPGFRGVVLARKTRTCGDFERYNPNLVGGDIVGGVTDWRQLLARPVWLRNPHATPNANILLCSSSTPPGGGVHGMCGFHAARLALKRFA